MAPRNPGLRSVGATARDNPARRAAPAGPGQRGSAPTEAARSILATRPVVSLLVAASAGALAGWLIKR